MSKVIGSAEPVELWQAPWEYEQWKLVVLQGRFLDEDKLKALYAEQWEPQTLHYALGDHELFNKPPKSKKSRQVVIDQSTAEMRIAKAIWVECGRLILRRLTPEARQFVCNTQERAERAAKIIVHRA